MVLSIANITIAYDGIINHDVLGWTAAAVMSLAAVTGTIGD